MAARARSRRPSRRDAQGKLSASSSLAVSVIPGFVEEGTYLAHSHRRRIPPRGAEEVAAVHVHVPGKRGADILPSHCSISISTHRLWFRSLLHGDEDCFFLLPFPTRGGPHRQGEEGNQY